MENNQSNVPDLKDLVKRISVLEHREAVRARTRKGLLRFGGVAFALGIVVYAGTALSDPVSPAACDQSAHSDLYCFVANTPAMAERVNSNFEMIVDWLEQKVGTVGTDAITVDGEANINGAVINTAGRVLINDSSDSYDVWIQGNTSSTSGGDDRNLALLGIDEDSGDYLYLNYASEYAGGVTIGGPVNIVGDINISAPQHASDCYWSACTDAPGSTGCNNGYFVTHVELPGFGESYGSQDACGNSDDFRVRCCKL
jgi:hypothetical protein